MRTLLASALLVSTLGCLAGCPPKQAAAPTFALNPIEVPMSVLEAPLLIALNPIKTELESTIDKRATQTGAWKQGNPGVDEGGIAIKYDIRREPVSVSAVVDGIDFSFVFDFWVKVRFRLLGALKHADSDDHRRAQVTCSSRPKISSAWDLDPNLSVSNVTMLNKVVVKSDFIFPDVITKDVTPMIRGRIKKMVSDKLSGMTSLVQRKADVKRRVERLWSDMSKPTPIGDLGTFILNPEQLSVGTLQPAGGDRLSIPILVTCRPRIVWGQVGDQETLPLPQNTSASVGASFNITLPFVVKLEDLTTELQKRMDIEHGGKRFPPTGKKYVKVKDIEAYAYGRKIVVRTHLKGSINVIVYASGTPQIDFATSTLYVPDLQFTRESQNLLTKVALWLMHSEIRNIQDVISAQAKVDISSELEKANRMFNKAINSKMGDVRLSGQLDSGGIRLLGVYADGKKNTATIYLNAAGRVRAYLD